jgi:hypothetical protein
MFYFAIEQYTVVGYMITDKQKQTPPSPTPLGEGRENEYKERVKKYCR